MSKDYIIYALIIAVIYLLYKNICNSSKIEKMTNTNDIKQKINEIYQVDVEAIRNLSLIAEKLQKDGLILPGDITIKGNIRLGDGSTILSQQDNQLQIKNKFGNVRIGPKNSKYNVFDTDRENHFFNNGIRINGKSGYFQGKDF